MKDVIRTGTCFTATATARLGGGDPACVKILSLKGGHGVTQEAILPMQLSEDECPETEATRKLLRHRHCFGHAWLLGHK